MALTIYYVLDAEPGIAVTPLTISSRLFRCTLSAASGTLSLMCNLYSVTKGQQAIRESIMRLVVAIVGRN